MLSPVYIGLDAERGRNISGTQHLAQSIRDILTTPIGSRVMRRDYGSRFPRLLDAPINQSLLAEARASVADALARWEPRLELSKVRAREAAPGRLTIDVEGRFEGRDIILGEVV